MVITADGQRAGATEQLAAFTKLLGISLVVACHPRHPRPRADASAEPTPVLIDHAGCNPFDAAPDGRTDGARRHRRRRRGARPPGRPRPGGSRRPGSAYSAAGARLLVATRLDLTRRLGGVLAAASADLALTEAGIGPGAADGLLPITPAWLAARLLTGSRP